MVHSREFYRIQKPTPVIERDHDAELAELAALIESGDTSEAALERMADLLGQPDPNSDKL